MAERSRLRTDYEYTLTSARTASVSTRLVHQITVTCQMRFKCELSAVCADKNVRVLIRSTPSPTPFEYIDNVDERITLPPHLT